jgi:hypothetical protein
MEIIRNIRSKLAPPLSPERKALRESIWQETLEFQNMREGWSSPLSKMKRSEKRRIRIGAVIFVVLIATIWADFRRPICPSNITPRNWHGQCRFAIPSPFQPVSKP